MLLTVEQSKYLEADGEGFRFIGENEASEEERQRLREFDESCVDIYGKHIITNYEVLKSVGL